jgi:hypothetical protein
MLTAAGAATIGDDAAVPGSAVLAPPTDMMAGG